MSCDWEIRTLSEVVSFHNNERIPLKSLDRAERQGDYPYYGASGIVDHIDGYIFDGDFLLISEDGENLRTRNTPIAFQAKGKFWVNNHAHILSEKEDGILDYLELYFSQLNLTPYITGAVQPKLNKANLDKIPVPIPPISQRLKINKVLNGFTKKIHLNTQTNQTLEAMAQALFKSWFVDFDPVKAKMRGEQPEGMDAATAALFPDCLVESELGMIPKGWEVEAFGNIADIASSKRIFAKEYQESGVPFYRGKEVTKLSQREPVLTEIYISEQRYLELEDKFGVPKDGDILITSVGTIGNTYLVNEDDRFYFKDGNLTWVKGYKSYINSLYLLEWLRSSLGKSTIENIQIGSTQKAITINSLNNIKLIIPCIEIHQRFHNLMHSIQKTLFRNTKQSQTLANLRDTLLPKLLSGQINLNDIEGNSL